MMIKMSSGASILLLQVEMFLPSALITITVITLHYPVICTLDF